jgi:hypothetical protein
LSAIRHRCCIRTNSAGSIGGDKRSQSKDINKAKQYWAQYLEEKQNGKA